MTPITMATVALIALIWTMPAHADEVGLRLGTLVSPDSNEVVQFPSGDPHGNGYAGKMIEGVYDWEPDLAPYFYLEGALGYRTNNDLWDYASLSAELSPGIKVEAGPLVIRLSEGLSFQPQNQFDPNTYEGFNKLDLVTHLQVGLKDPKTGVGIYFDRSHYSNGSSTNNPSLNYAGFMLLFPL